MKKKKIGHHQRMASASQISGSKLPSPPRDSMSEHKGWGTAIDREFTERLKPASSYSCLAIQPLRFSPTRKPRGHERVQLSSGNSPIRSPSPPPGQTAVPPGQGEFASRP